MLYRKWSKSQVNWLRSLPSQRNIYVVYLVSLMLKVIQVQTNTIVVERRVSILNC
jgi:hypothetical protein